MDIQNVQDLAPRIRKWKKKKNKQNKSRINQEKNTTETEKKEIIKTDNNGSLDIDIDIPSELPPLDRCISNPLMRQYSDLSVLSDNEGAHFVPYGRGHYNIANSPQNNKHKQNKNKQNQNANQLTHVHVQSKYTPVDQVQQTQTQPPNSQDKKDKNRPQALLTKDGIVSITNKKKHIPPKKPTRPPIPHFRTPRHSQSVESLASDLSSAHVPVSVSISIDSNNNIVVNSPQITSQQYLQLQLQQQQHIQQPKQKQKRKQAQDRVIRIQNNVENIQISAPNKQTIPEQNIETIDKDNIYSQIRHSAITEESPKKTAKKLQQKIKQVKKGVYRMRVKEELVCKSQSNPKVQLHQMNDDLSSIVTVSEIRHNNINNNNRNINGVKSTHLLNKHIEKIMTNSPTVSETSQSTSNGGGHFLDDYFKKKAAMQQMQHKSVPVEQQIYLNNTRTPLGPPMPLSSMPIFNKQPININKRTHVFSNNIKNNVNKRQIPINSPVYNSPIKPVYNNIMYNINIPRPLMKRPPPTIHRPNNGPLPPVTPITPITPKQGNSKCNRCSGLIRNSNNSNRRLIPQPQPPKKRNKGNNGAPNKWEICWEFNSKKGCKWGRDCYWKHAYYNR